MKLRTLVASVLLGSLVGAVVRAALVDLDTLPAPAPARVPSVPFYPTRLERLQAELAAVDRGIARAAELLRAGKPYDRDAAALLLRQRDTLSTLIEAERLKEPRK